MLEIKNLSLSFTRYERVSFKKENMKIISNFNLSVKKGEIVAIIGSSGSGKSLLAHAIIGILPKNAVTTGEIIYKNEVLTSKKQKSLRGKEIVLIPQSVNFLDPLKTVGSQVERTAFINHKDSKKAKDLTEGSFLRYNLKNEVKKYYPFQVSGGMARRVLTAMATVTKADLIIADEPTTGLDSNAIDESLSYLRKLADRDKGIILITHDIKYALKYADKIAVFYGGTTVEIVDASCFKDVKRLHHPYSKELFLSLPQNGFTYIPGLNPFGQMLTGGCVFHPRCSQSKDGCKCSSPEEKIKGEGKVWCHNA
jgi:peptide/nickel transport system ATP-binding protein